MRGTLLGVEPNRRRTQQASNPTGVEPNRRRTQQASNPTGVEPNRRRTQQASNPTGVEPNSVLLEIIFPDRASRYLLSLFRFSKFLRYSKRLLVALVIAISIVSPSLLNSGVTARAQSLDNCTNGDYCYEIVNWPNTVTGTATEIEVEFITCGYCSGHLSNETWLTASNCGCWIETGYSTYGPNSGDNKYSCSKDNRVNCYFWADERPNGGGYDEHAKGSIPNQGYGNFASFEIYLNQGVKDYCGGQWVSNADWTIDIDGPSNDHWDGLKSTCNQITAGSIQTGEELENSGAASPATLFIDNQWQDLPTYNWTFQANNGTNNKSDNPPKGYWYIYPTNSNTGGEWEACTSGC